MNYGRNTLQFVYYVSKRLFLLIHVFRVTALRTLDLSIMDNVLLSSVIIVFCIRGIILYSYRGSLITWHMS
jgi:hypothetical protein